MDIKFLTTKEAVKIIEQETNKPMSVRQLEHQIQLGLLKAQKIGHVYLIDPNDLKNYKRNKVGRPINIDSQRQKNIELKKLNKQKHRPR
jgi:hypothetical protein